MRFLIAESFKKSSSRRWRFFDTSSRRFDRTASCKKLKTMLNVTLIVTV